MQDTDIFNAHEEKNRVKDFCFDGTKNWKFSFLGFDVFEESSQRKKFLCIFIKLHQVIKLSW